MGTLSALLTRFATAAHAIICECRDVLMANHSEANKSPLASVKTRRVVLSIGPRRRGRRALTPFGFHISASAAG